MDTLNVCLYYEIKRHKIPHIHLKHPFGTLLKPSIM